MRITNHTMVDRSLRDISLNQERVARVQNDISSGKKIHRSSDDPVGAARAHVLRNTMAKNNQYQKNIGNAHEFLHTTDQAIGSYVGALQRLRTLAVQGASGNLRTEDKAAISREVNQIREELVAIGNTQQGGRYIFGGLKTNQAPFPTNPPVLPNTPTDVTLGPNDNGLMSIEIAPGQTINYNVPGTSFMGNTAPPSTANIFAEIDAFVGYLTSGTSTPEVSTLSLPAFDKYIASATATRTELGGRITRLDLAENRLAEVNLNLDQLLQETESTDIAEASMRLNQHEAAFRAALSVGARAIPLSLVDFLR